MNADTIEIVKIFISLLTPVTVLTIGVSINRRLERNKIEFLKEKEWQVRWAELFLNQAIEYNRNLSLLMSSFFMIHDPVYDKDEIQKQILKSFSILLNINWDIQNFAQFAEKHGKEVIETQKQISEALNQMIVNKGGDSEVIRKLQFKYNQAVRKAHNEILNTV